MSIVPVLSLPFRLTAAIITPIPLGIVMILAAIAVPKELGYEAVEEFPARYHGFDGLFRHGDTFIIVEAKGGAASLGRTAAGGQLSQNWIIAQIDRLRSRGFEDWALRLDEARRAGKVNALLVTTPVDRVAQTVGDPSFVLKAWNEISESIF